MKQVQIRHPELGFVGECLPESLPAWERNGWVAVTEDVAAPVSDDTPVTPSKQNDPETTEE